MIIKKYNFLIIIIFLSFIFYAVLTKEYALIRSQKINAWTDDVSADCAVVLTGGPKRLSEGLDLLYTKSIKKLIISGVYPQTFLIDMFPQWPLLSGLSEKDVILEKRSTTTFGNAVHSLALVQALDCREVLLVTSHLHMYRAFKTFRAQYPDTINLMPFATVGSGYRSGFFETWLEVVKSIFYRFWAY